MRITALLPLMRTPARLAAIVVLALLAGGCQTFSLGSISDLNPFGSDSEPQACPRAASLADAVSITEFGRDASRDESNIIYTAVIERTLFDCEVVGGQVQGRVALVGTLTLGRKGNAGPVSLPIFVALTRDNTDVVSKRFETIEFEIERGATTARFEKEVRDYTFNLAGASTASYEILSGFNLTPEQISYNRLRQGR